MMRAVWRSFAFPCGKSGPFVGLHIVDVVDGVAQTEPRCGSLDGAIQAVPKDRPTGYVVACVDCLEFSEWAMNNA